MNKIIYLTRLCQVYFGCFKRKFIISGRPIGIKNIVDSCDVILAAWLPGTQGGTGIADILFGENLKPDAPTGKLSFTWPYVELGQMKTLYPFYYGLTY